MNDILFSSIEISELEILIQKSVRKVLNEKHDPIRSEPIDRCDLSEAIKLTRLSKSQLYKLTCSNKIPFQKFGKRLVFSRKQLHAWIGDHTVSVYPHDDDITKRLVSSARKKR